MSVEAVGITQAADALSRAPAAIAARMDAALEQGRVLIARDAVRLAPKADGTLIRNIHQSRIAQLMHVITSDAPTAAWVERGTGTLGPYRRASGNQMLSASGVAAIALWIQRKGIVPKSPNVSAATLPWLIARKIAITGTRAQPYMAPAAEKNIPGLNARFNEAVTLGLQDVGLTGA